MPTTLTNNILSSLTGTVRTTPIPVNVDNCMYYSFTMTTARKSGYDDIVEVLVEDMSQVPAVGERARVVGFIFAYYDESHLKLCVYSVGTITVTCFPDKNLIMCVGTITKTPSIRTTPFGTTICDVLLAVNNEIGDTHSSYIPCVTWNTLAEDISKLSVGDKILVLGRLQSREYVKNTLLGPEKKIAKELSINSFNILKEN